MCILLAKLSDAGKLDENEGWRTNHAPPNFIICCTDKAKCQI